MFKKIVLVSICLIMFCGLITLGYNNNNGPSDETEKEIEGTNYLLSLHCSSMESEGVYYYDVRKLIKSANVMWDWYDEQMKDPEFISWQEETGYKDRPNHRRIFAKDLSIPTYSGQGVRLSAEEYKVATDFSKEYVCKTFGDLVSDVMSDESERLKYYQSKGLISQAEMLSAIQLGTGGVYTYTGSERLKEIFISLPLFNKDKLELNETGYYTNYKMFIK